MSVLTSAIAVAAALAVAAGCASTTTAPAATGESAIEVVGPPRTAAELSWMAGDWIAREGESTQEESWSAPLGGLMLGHGRTVIGGRARFFEQLRIEERADGLVYVASPLGRASTEFRLTDGGAKRARFENPAHDWPNAIEYELRDDGTLAARVSGAGRTEEFAWQRAR